MGAGRPGTTADTQWGDRVGGLTSDLRLCTTAFAFGFVRPDCVLMPRLGVRYRTSRHPPPSSLLPRPLYTHTGSGEQQHDLFVVPILAGRVRGGGGGGDPRETAGEVGERINRVSGGLAPEFQTFPVNRRRGRGRGGRGVRVAGARDGTKVSVCIKPRERQERLQAVGSPRTSRRGVCYAGCAARGYVPCLTSHDSNSTQTLPAFCICWSAFPRSFARSYVRTFARNSRDLRFLTSADHPPPPPPSSPVGSSYRVCRVAKDPLRLIPG